MKIKYYSLGLLEQHHSSKPHWLKRKHLNRALKSQTKQDT